MVAGIKDPRRIPSDTTTLSVVTIGRGRVALVRLGKAEARSGDDSGVPRLAGRKEAAAGVCGRGRYARPLEPNA